MGEVDENFVPNVPKAKETYGEFCKELNKLGLAYVQVMRWWAAYDPMLGGKVRGVDWDPIAYLRPILQNTIIMGNTGFTPEEADEWIKDGKVDMVAVGRPLLYNPDYVELLEEGRREEMYDEQPGDEFFWYKYRNNDKLDGYLNWKGRSQKFGKTAAKDALGFIHD